MANFDDILKNKLESFEDGGSPSVAELNRLNRSLDLISSIRIGWRRYILYALLILLLLSQLYLIWSNRRTQKLISGQHLQIDSLEYVLKERQNQHEKFLQHARSEKAAFNNSAPIDSQKVIGEYLTQNDQLLEKLVRDAIVTNRLGLVSMSSLKNIGRSQHLATSDGDLVKTDKDENKETQGTATATKSQKTGRPNPRIDTVVVREISVDSALYDSLINLVHNDDQKVPQQDPPLPKTPKTYAWTLGAGIKPAYSNLYLLDGRVVFGGHLTTGFSYNNSWTLNTGLQYRAMRVHEDVVDSASNPVLGFEQFKSTQFQTPFEIEGAAQGFYLPLDFQYFYPLGNLKTFARVGCDVNLITSEKYKIEDNDQYYPLDQLSRRMQVSSISLSAGASTQLTNRWSLEYEGGYLIGRALDPILLSDKNGLFLQARVVYILKRG